MTTLGGIDGEKVMGSQCGRGTLSSPAVGSQWMYTKGKSRERSETMSIRNTGIGEFPGGLVVRILDFHCHGLDLIPGQGT